MKKIICFSVFTLFLLTSIGAQTSLRVLSFNIRLNTEVDGENQWKFRKDYVAQLVQFYEADIIGMQEVKHDQILDLDERLPGYARLGVGRDDGKEGGEYSPIFYKKDKVELLESNTFWLSQTPTVPGSKHWDAAITRVCSWGKFKDKATGKEFFAFNTHFDHIGEISRQESAKIIVQKATELAGNLPVFFTGDFNARPDSEAYKNVTTGKNAMTDSFFISEEPHYGPIGTFHAFKQPTEDDGNRIDYVFVKNGITVLKHATLTDSKGGKFPSDHFPVLAVVKLPE